MYNYASSFCIIGQLLVVYAPFFQGIFQTEGLWLSDLVLLTLLSSTVLWVDEFRKYREAKWSYAGGSIRTGNSIDEDQRSLLV